MTDDGDDALQRVARELYAVVPAEFVSARNGRVAQLRKAGATDVATVVAALPKATAPAWAVGAVVRELPAEIDELCQLGAELRVAQASANAAELRELSRRRRALTSRVAQAAAGLAANHGVALSVAALAQVAATWHAVVIDRDAERAVRSGLLVRPLEPGAVDLASALGVPGAVEEDTPEVDDDDEPAAFGATPAARSGEREAREAERTAEMRQAERVLREAERSAEASRDNLAETANELDRLQAEALRATAELEEARRQLADREAALAALDERQEVAHKAHEAAAARSEEAERAVTEARARASGQRS